MEFLVCYSFVEIVADLKRLENNPQELFDLLDQVESDLDIGENDDGWDDEIGSQNQDNGNEDDSDAVSDTSESNQDDNSDSSDDNIPLIRFSTLQWKRSIFVGKGDPNNENLPQGEPSSPWHYFQKYLNDDFFQMGATFTGQYYLQQTGKVLTITPEDIKKFFGMHAIMDCLKFPRINMYWNSEFQLPLLSNVMPRERFYLLRVNFHIVDNLAVDDDTKKANRL